MPAPPLHALRVDGCIGKGSFGDVYLCSRKTDQDKQHAERWALKVVHKSRLGTSEHREQTKTEVDVLRLAAPCRYIVGLHWARDTPCSVILCLELCDGGDLYSALIRGSVHDGNCKPVLAEIAAALHFLHSRNVVFRDLKPENVALTRGGHVRLIDMGLAVVLSEADRDAESGRLMTYSEAGTLPYAAPEVLRRKRHSFEVDWWGLGVLTHELLCGYSPFEDDDDMACCRRICTAPLDLGLAPDSVEAAFVCGLLQREPSERLVFEDIQQHQFFEHEDPSILASVELP